MRGSIEAVSKNLLTSSFLQQRTRDGYIYITNQDLKDHNVPKYLSIQLVVSLNDEAKRSGITLPIIAISNGIEKTRVKSMDLYSLMKYRVSRIVEIGEIEPRLVSKELTCPACKNHTIISEPLYIPPTCPFKCDLNPERWIGNREEIIDVVSGKLLLDCEDDGYQEVKFFIDRYIIGANRNYKKLTSWVPPNILIIDAFPVPVYLGNKRMEFALWISNVEVSGGRDPGSPPRGKLQFQAPEIVKAEKDVVNGLFFRNFDYMRELFHFDHYYQQTAFPDLIIRETSGAARVIEFEYESKNFDLHKHDANLVDYIVCWIDNRKKVDKVVVVELKKLIGTSI